MKWQLSFEKELYTMHRFIYTPDSKMVLGSGSQRRLDLIKINMGLKICLILQAQASQDTQVLLQAVTADSPWSAMEPPWCYLGNSRQSGIDRCTVKADNNWSRNGPASMAMEGTKRIEQVKREWKTAFQELNTDTPLLTPTISDSTMDHVTCNFSIQAPS